MARKRKSAATATDQCPRDLNEIPYIAWMNKQLAAGRKPAGPLPEGTPEAGDTSYQALRDVPTRGRRATDRVASSRVLDDAAFGNDDDDSDYNECDDGTEDDADSGEEEDKGMSDSEEDADADDADADYADGDEDDAPEEAQPAAQTSRRGRGTIASGAKTAAKGGEPPRGAAKTRNLHPVKRSVWSPRESTILVAARWFMKDELEPLIGKQGSQYWARLVRHIEKENTGWVRGVNAVQKQWRNLVTMYKQLKKGEKTSGKGAVSPPPQSTPTSKRPRVAAPAAMAAAKLVCETIKGCHSDAMNRLEGLVRAWMEQDERIARESQAQPAPTPPARNDIPATSDPQPATNAAEGGDDRWFRRGQAGDGAANPDAAEEVWVRGDDE
ncbi:unnamed protein product [Closterium sp. Naga37s-1]|nr:unnamed protein product [Closterium sp. Naga37s-1]